MIVRKIPKELAILFSTLGMATSVEIDPSSPLSEDEQVKAAIAEAEAAHRLECDACRAEYEKEQKVINRPRADRREGKDRRRATGLSQAHAAPYNGTARDRVVIGYMAYVGDTPIIGTFDEVENSVMGAINEFTNDIGSDILTVRAVYG